MRARLVVLCGVFAAGCESTADVVAKHRSGVEQTFTALKSLQSTVASTPALEKASVTATAVPLRLEGEGANAMFIYAEDLADAAHARPVALRSLDSTPLLHCGALLEKQQLFNDVVTRPSPSVVGGTLEACAHLRFALVIRLTQYLRPELQLETKQFAPGRYRADVLVFDLTTHAALGGFPIGATNDSRVSLLDGDQNHVQRLIGNLESTVFDALRAGAREAFPGSLPTPPAK